MITGNCTDQLENCSRNSQMCNNQAYYAFMTRMCPRTCQRCLANSVNYPRFTLYYFNLRNRGESIRMLLNYVQQDFIDFRFEGRDWPTTYKNQMPFKHVPVLVQDCTFTLSQSTAILRYLARMFGVEADRLEEQALVDMYGEQLNDYITALVPWGRTRFDQSQSFNMTQQFNAVVPPVVEELGTMFSQQLLKNSGYSGYLVGPKVTWVDFLLAEVVDMLQVYGRSDIFNNYRSLLQHRDRVFSLPTLQQYVRTRPTPAY
ncbi:GST-36 protein [Aphelenchoides avenae]|nr:GST-36 protein [Aphelenchus avenae]